MSRFGNRSRVGQYLSDWMPTGDEPFFITGGQEKVAVGGFTYVVFTSSGTATLNNLAGSATVGICTVGGGGGAGFDIGGGGGGGELDLFANFTVTQNLTITIGSGGAFGTGQSVKGSNGGTSTVVELTSTLQSALGGGGGGSFTQNTGLTGGSGGGGGGASTPPIVGGGASGSNTFAGGTAVVSGGGYIGGGGGGATAVGSSANGNGGQGYALSTIDANLTSANFPTTLTSKTHVSSGGGGGVYNLIATPQGGTNAGNGGEWLPSSVNSTSPTSYGCGGGGGQLNTAGTAGFNGLVILRYAS